MENKIGSAGTLKRKLLCSVALFLFANLCAWYVFWASGEDMYTVHSGAAAFLGIFFGVFGAAIPFNSELSK